MTISDGRSESSQLEQMLRDIPLASFVSDYYHHRPYSAAGGAHQFLPVGTWEVLFRLLKQPQVDQMVCRRNEQWQGPLPNDEVGIRGLLTQGYTILVRHAEQLDEQLARLADSFAADFLAAVNIHVYCTPGEQYGFGWHYDAEEVFLIQTMGRKEYSLRKNTVHPWPLEETLPADMQYEREIMPVMRCELAAGDWLYVPSGYWHMGRALETGITLAIGVRPHAAIEWIDCLRQQLVQSLFWRQRLPVSGRAAASSHTELNADYERLLSECAREIGKALVSPDRAADFLKYVEEIRPAGNRNRP